MIEQCKAGSRKAQRIFFDRYYSYGYRIARRYSSTSEDAKEILSNAYLRVFKKMELYNSEKAFEHWFARIIIHASSDYYRYANNKTSDIMEYEYKLQNEDTNIIDHLSYEELLVCVSDLSPMYRSVFNMYVMDGYKHAEIAETLNISVGTSKSNLSKAKRQLQNILKVKHEI